MPAATVENLPQIQSYVRLLDNLATRLLLFALVLLALGIWLAPSHRRAALIGAAMIAVLMVVMLIVLNGVRGTYENEVANRDLNVPAALALCDTLLTLPRVGDRGAPDRRRCRRRLALAGRPGSRRGRTLRRWGRRGEQAVADRLDRAGLKFGPVARFAARFGTPVVIGLGLLAGWGLLRSPTIGLALWLSAGRWSSSY